ncbi:hypothetical protein Tsubulata_035776 [Turnera subulata]|uniref:HMG box domain-containing protein n=1 Tax=Turnera subulata TaxID=218843 RepID=A0A9Q0F6J0_9ROSI|nr:hypothetical protein Tsubulata_035776 [Turnera subulata]
MSLAKSSLSLSHLGHVLLKLSVLGAAMKGAESKAGAKPADNKLKRKGAGVSKAAKKAAKDPNKPKRPPSAFFGFMEEFRQEFKEKHPNNKSVAVIKGKSTEDPTNDIVPKFPRTRVVEEHMRAGFDVHGAEQAQRLIERDDTLPG